MLKSAIYNYLSTIEGDSVDIFDLVSKCSFQENRRLKELLSDMNVGDKIVYPASKYDSVRSSLSRYQKAWQQGFAYTKKEDMIIITRTK